MLMRRISIAVVAVAAVAPIARAQDPGAGANEPKANSPRAETDSVSAALARGEEIEKKGQLDAACAHYKTALDKFAKDPEAARLRLRFGRCLAKQLRFEEARMILQQARDGAGTDAIRSEADAALKELARLSGAPETGAGVNEPKANSPRADKPEPPKPEPAKPEAKPEPPAEPTPREKAQAEIDKIKAEKQELIERAHKLEDEGKVSEAYALRKKADALIPEIEKRRGELDKMPRDKPRPLAKGPAPDGPEAREGRRKLMQRRLEEIESQAGKREEKAKEARAAGKEGEAKALEEEAARLRREAQELAQKLDLKRPTAAAPAKTPPRPAEDEGKLERLAKALEARGLQPEEVRARLELAKKEMSLEKDQHAKLESLRKELEEKKVSPDEVREKLEALAREHRGELERLREEAERAIAEHHRVAAEKEEQEHEREIARARDELKAKGAPPEEIERRIGEMRRERERKAGKKREKDGDVRDKDERELGPGRKAVVEEFQRMRRRIEELERVVQELRKQLEEMRREREEKRKDGTSKPISNE